MKTITRTRMTQICAAVKRGDDLADVAKKFGIPVERVEALTGAKGKKPKKPKVDKPKEPAASDEGGNSAADDFK